MPKLENITELLSKFTKDVAESESIYALIHQLPESAKSESITFDNPIKLTSTDESLEEFAIEDHLNILFIACLSGSLHAVRTVIEWAGKEKTALLLSQLTNGGLLPIHAAAKYCPEGLYLLLEHMPKTLTPHFQSKQLKLTHLSENTEPLTKKNILCFQGRDGFAPLHLIAQYNPSYMLQTLGLLNYYSANLNVFHEHRTGKENNGFTALEILLKFESNSTSLKGTDFKNSPIRSTESYEVTIENADLLSEILLQFPTYGENLIANLRIRDQHVNNIEETKSLSLTKFIHRHSLLQFHKFATNLTIDQATMVANELDPLNFNGFKDTYRPIFAKLLCKLKRDDPYLRGEEPLKITDEELPIKAEHFKFLRDNLEYTRDTILNFCGNDYEFLQQCTKEQHLLNTLFHGSRSSKGSDVRQQFIGRTYLLNLEIKLKNKPLSYENLEKIHGLWKYNHSGSYDIPEELEALKKLIDNHNNASGKTSSPEDTLAKEKAAILDIIEEMERNSIDKHAPFRHDYDIIMRLLKNNPTISPECYPTSTTLFAALGKAKPISSTAPTAGSSNSDIDTSQRTSPELKSRHELREAERRAHRLSIGISGNPEKTFTFICRLATIQAEMEKEKECITSPAPSFCH